MPTFEIDKNGYPRLVPNAPECGCQYRTAEGPDGKCEQVLVQACDLHAANPKARYMKPLQQGWTVEEPRTQIEKRVEER